MAAPALSFSPQLFAKLSPHPYLLRNLTPSSPSSVPVRTNARVPQEARPVQIQTSSLSQANGSALVRLGDTSVLCGVRAEILPVTAIPQYRPKSIFVNTDTTRDELKNYDLLVPNIELATGCAPQFLPGGPPSTLAQTLSTRVYSLLHSSGVVEGSDLRIWHTAEKEKTEGQMDTDEEEEDNGDDGTPELKAYWVLYIDVLFVSFDGNAFDAAWMAVMAALKDTKLPSARWDSDRETVVCSRKTMTPLAVRGLPVACTAAVFLEKEQGEPGEGRHWILLDPDRLEETLCKESITMVVDCSDGEVRVKAIEKSGGTVLGRELIRGFAGVAESRWKAVEQAMKP
ncbi:hypothetical protein OQA88_6307 [Cercophora sp. LCS_1]